MLSLVRSKYHWQEVCSDGLHFAPRPFCNDVGCSNGRRWSGPRLGGECPLRTNGPAQLVPHGRPSSRNQPCAKRGALGDIDPRDLPRARPSRLRNGGKGHERLYLSRGTIVDVTVRLPRVLELENARANLLQPGGGEHRSALHAPTDGNGAIGADQITNARSHQDRG